MFCLSLYFSAHSKDQLQLDVALTMQTVGYRSFKYETDTEINFNLAALYFQLSIFLKQQNA